MRLYRPRRRGTFGLNQRRAFVATRSGLQSMPSGLGDDEDTVAGAFSGNVRPPAPPAQSAGRPRDLQIALAEP